MNIHADLINQAKSFLEGKKKIVIVQGDNPDGDSLASSLALEQILHEAGIEAYMVCSVEIGRYLRYLSGWDRVLQEPPSQFDGWILVDCEYMRLLDNLASSGVLDELMQKPLLVIDHHSSPTDIDFAEAIINVPEAGSSGHVIYELAKELNLNISLPAAECIAVSILSDTLGFNSEVMVHNPGPLRVMAELVDIGVNLAELNNRRLEQFKITPDIFRYKAELMQRVEFHHDNRIATLDIPHDEIKEYSFDYNPTVVLDETKNIDGLAVMIGLKSYEKDGRIYKITGRIRCGYGYKIAADLAAHFKDGGGHPYAAGFKIEGDDLNFADIKHQAIAKAYELLH